MEVVKFEARKPEESPSSSGSDEQEFLHKDIHWSDAHTEFLYCEGLFSDGQEGPDWVWNAHADCAHFKIEWFVCHLWKTKMSNFVVRDEQ
jgi:hypothetical protein